MSDIVIRVENLGKKYIIGHETRESYTTLRDVIARKTKQIVGKTRQLLRGGQLIAGTELEEFWALKEINFEIKQGESIGIIGRNGAGKSTLLKVLSRITEPTTGRVTIRGRVASLLEVGTGFSPELSGRENIYLNGAILGMSQKEIKNKFDEIVDFSGIEKFLDTPVKRYSSGMYVRLAFAIAAHLESEILVVDEVLAVGDAEFQKKCLGKMGDVAHQGRTVLFVSHNITAIRGLCNKGILLNGGQIITLGTIENVIKSYINDAKNIVSSKIWDNFKLAPGNDIVKLWSIRAVNSKYQPKQSFKVNEKFGIEAQYEVFIEGHILWQGYNIFNAEGINIFDTHNVTSKWYYQTHPIGKFKSIVWIPENLLGEGDLIISYAIFNLEKGVIHLHEKNIIRIQILDTFSDEEITSRGKYLGPFPGIIRPLLNWEDMNNI